MANYVKATNFYTKDALLTGNPNKIIKGAEIDAEYNAIATAVASKADTTSPTFTGTPVAPTAVSGTNTTQLATTAFITTAITNALAVAYPVGSIYTSTVATNPGTLFGFGTWVAFGVGRVLIGNGGGYTAGATGGSADAVVVSHTHTATSSVSDPGHSHTMSPNADGYSAGNASNSVRGAGGGLYAFSTQSATTGITVGTSVASAGVSGTNANLPPYVVVYMWNRTA
jgi:hypothetical protein